MLAYKNPATNEQFGEVPVATPAEVTQAVFDLRAAYKIWGFKPLRERIRILRALQGAIIDSMDEIAEVINQDCGKSRQDALIEVFVTLDLLNAYLKHAPVWLRRQRVPRGYFFFKRLYTEPRPLGLVAVIAPWNYPFALSMPPVIAALLAGNTVILKPSEVTPGAGVMIEKLFRRLPELSPFVRVLHGDGAVGAAVIQANPDFVFLTGSTGTGKKVYQAAAERLIPVALELGGKDAMIVLEDADVSASAHWGVWGSCFNTGQTCVSVERIYVVEQIFDEFLEKAIQEMSQLKIGYTPDQECPYYLGPLTDPRQVKTVQEHLDDALSKGARLVAGGKRNGMFFEPTMLVDVNHDMLVMQEETFGPLLPIVRVKDEAEAVRLANDCKFGLGASIWTANFGRARRLARQMEVGAVIVNDVIAHFAAPMLPFGGVKSSGFARIHGKQGLLQFTQAFAYVEGSPPKNWDITTVFRRPMHYAILAAITGLLFGVTLRQRVKPAMKMMKNKRRGA